jgi:hypothetical protein
MSGDFSKERVAAQRYAFKFLANKYYEEYRELYCAYLANRGIPTRAMNDLVDERVIQQQQEGIAP